MLYALVNRCLSLAVLPGGLTVIGSVALPAVASPALNSMLPSISAEHVRRHVPSDTELLRAQIDFSADGLRARERLGSDDLELVQNFTRNRLWFIDRRRRVSHEILLEDVELDVESNSRELNPLLENPVTNERGGLLGAEPCLGLEARFDQTGTWRGRLVSAWSCLAAGGEVVAKELMDDDLGIVVRHRSNSGHVDELIDIRLRVFPPDHFAPAAEFRPVSAGELIRGSAPIDDYDDPLSSIPTDW